MCECEREVMRDGLWVGGDGGQQRLDEERDECAPLAKPASRRSCPCASRRSAVARRPALIASSRFVGFYAASGRRPDRAAWRPHLRPRAHGEARRKCIEVATQVLAELVLVQRTLVFERLGKVCHAGVPFGTLPRRKALRPTKKNAYDSILAVQNENRVPWTASA